MKRLMFVLVMFVFAASASFAQSKEDKADKKKAKYDASEVSIDQVPSDVMASLQENGVEASNVLKVYEIKKDQGKIYKFKVSQGGEKMKYKFDASGKLLHKGAWQSDEATSSTTL